MLWLGIYLPALPLEVFEKTPSPAAICNDKKIIAVNSCAAQHGVIPGLKKSTALSLCSQLRLKVRDTYKEQTVLKQLANLAYQFSDQVIAYSNQQQQYSLLLEISGSIRLFGNQSVLINQIQEALSQVHTDTTQANIHAQRYSCSLAIATTCKAAEVKARYTTANNPQVSDDYNDCTTVANIELEEIPITYLDVPTKTIQQCMDMGLDSIGAVLTLPMAALRKRFNADFIDYLQQLNGSKPDDSTVFTPSSFFSRECFFIDGLRSHKDLLIPIEKLLHELCRYLQQHQQQCLSIDWLFTRFSRKKHPVFLRFSEPQHNYKQLLALTQLQLNQIPIDSPIETVQLTVKAFCHTQQQSQDFFSQQNQRGNPLLLADTLRGKLGEKSLYTLHNNDKLLPEEKNYYQSFNTTSNTARRKDILSNKKRVESINLSTGSPLKVNHPAWLFNPPKKLSKRNHQLYQNKYPITLTRGPERIETRWWKKQACRDYYIATLNNPNDQSMLYLCSVFYNRRDRQWYLQGLYA